MTRLFYLMVGIVVGGAAVMVSLNYHVLRTDDGYAMVPKMSSGFQDAYVDIREFGVTDWVSHRPLVAAIVKAKKEHLIQSAVAGSWQDRLGELIPNVTQ